MTARQLSVICTGWLAMVAPRVPCTALSGGRPVMGGSRWKICEGLTNGDFSILAIGRLDNCTFM